MKLSCRTDDYICTRQYEAIGATIPVRQSKLSDRSNEGECIKESIRQFHCLTEIHKKCLRKTNENCLVVRLNQRNVARQNEIVLPSSKSTPVRQSRNVLPRPGRG